VERVAQSTAGRALVLKVNSDQHPQLAERYNVRGIPNFIVFRNGRVAMQQAGVVPHDQMQRWLE
jgi:thioredoxin 2